MPRIRRALAGFAALAFLLCGLSVAPAAAEGTAQGDVAELEKSLLYIQTEWHAYIGDPSVEGWPEVTLTSNCTAWWVTTDAKAMTAAHCVDPTDDVQLEQMFLQVYADQVGDPSLVDTAIAENWKVEGEEDGSPPDVKSVRAIQSPNVEGTVLNTVRNVEVKDLQVTKKGDIALLDIPQVSQETPALPIAQERPDIGSEMTAIGYPQIVEGITDPSVLNATFTKGSVTGHPVSAENSIPQLGTDADLGGGMSGGPAVVDGEVVGVNSSGIDEGGNAFNFITDTERLNDFLSSNNIEPVAATSGSSGEKNKGAAPVASAAAPDDSGSTWLIVGIAAGVIVLAVLAVFLMRRRSAPAGSTTPTGPMVLPIPPEALYPNRVGVPSPPQGTAMPMVRNCQNPNCGAMNQAGKFCTECGTPLGTPSNQGMPFSS
jgi:serine protease Do